MNILDFKKYLGLPKEVKEKDLSFDACHEEEIIANKERIKKLFDIALDEQVIVYFDGRYVEEPYDGLEFKTLEEELYYNNNNSYLVFVDSNGVKAKFKIRYLHQDEKRQEHKEFEFKVIYKVIEKACNYTKAHPEVSEYKLY